MGRATRTPEERFWAKVKKLEGDDPCWIWTASCFIRDGYGQFGLRAGKMVRAHRYSWELANGEIPEGLSVLHKCDNPICVRPAHLFLGTQKDNMVDCKAKGRTTHGVKNTQAKLTEEQVIQIRERRAKGEKGMDLAVEFGVSPAAISRIKKGHYWAHLAP